MIGLAALDGKVDPKRVREIGLLRAAAERIAELETATQRGPAMTLFSALSVLAETHTRDDDVTGFVIVDGASPASPMSPHPVERYNEAWNVVREQLHMQTFPRPWTR